MTASFSERWIAMKITELVNKILEGAEFVDMTRMMEEGMPYWPTQPAFGTRKRILFSKDCNV